MRIAEVIGRCTLSVCHPSLRGAKWVIGVPLTQEEIQNASAGKSKKSDAGRNEAFVIYDDLGAGAGDLIAGRWLVLRRGKKNFRGVEVAASS